MTTYPQTGDPQSAGTLADGSTISHQTEHGRTIGLWENVKHYGAHGDATVANYTTTATDDTATIQAALTAATGGVCYLPPRAYRVTGTLTIPSGTTFCGAGPGPDAFGHGSQLLVNITNGDPVLKVAGGSAHVTIKDMLIAGGAASGPAIFLDGSAVSAITHTTISNVGVGAGSATNFSIKAVWALETQITRCTCSGALGGGIYLGDTCNASVVRDNTFSNGGSGALGGLFLEGASGVLVEGNVFEGWRGAYGIKVSGAAQFSLIRNWVEDDDGIGIYITGLSHTANLIGNNTSGGVRSTYSLKVESCRRLYVSENIFAGAQTAEVALISTATVNEETTAVFSANQLDDAGGGRVDSTGLINTADQFIRLGDRRGDAPIQGAIEVVIGGIRQIGRTSFITWAPTVDAAADTYWASSYPKVCNTNTNGAIATGFAAHGSLPAASGYPAGAQFYCTSDKKPIWSDGSAHWVDAAGANHT